MPGWNPPNALLYLGSIIRPSLLKPDLKVPNWNALRKEGFDAVVIDKDNCLTLPERDELYPPLQTAWSSLLTAFPPGRVLIVSNSAGTLSKDPSGVAAESVSLALRAPILLHARPKPGCAPDIVSYLSPASHPPPSFGSDSGSGSGPDISTGSSGLPGPSTLRARIAAKHREALQAEKEDVQALVERFSGLASGPVWREGERVVAEGKGKDVLRRSFVDPDQAAKDLSQKRTAISSTSTSLPASPLEASLQQLEAPKQSLPKTYGPRIAVVGDRLFTDTLLANRLRALLPSQGTRDNIISIQTTLLPQPNDVRLLRRLESILTRDRLRQGSTDWGRYAVADKAPLTLLEEKEGWRRYIPFRQAYLNSPELQWDPRSWRPVTLAVAAGRGIVWVGRRAQVWTVKGARWGWASGQRWLARRKIGSEEIKNISKEGLP